MEHNHVYRALKATCEEMLDDYSKYYVHVKKREFQLANPVTPIDENVGGGKSNNYQNPIDRLMIKTSDDKYLTNLGANHSDIRVCYEEASEDVQTILEELYFKEPQLRKYHTINDLVNAHKISMSKTTAYIAWDDFIEKLIDQLGLARFLAV